MSASKSEEEEEEEQEDEEEVQKLLSCAVDAADLLLGRTSSRASTSKAHLHMNPHPHRLPRNNAPRSHSDNEQSVDYAAGLKLYQIRVQDLLHSYLDKTLGTSFSDSDELIEHTEEYTRSDEEMSSVRLFRHAPNGIFLGPNVETVARKIDYSSSSNEDLNEEDSSESVARLQAVVVDGATVQAEAARAAARALTSANREARAAELAARKEEERVASLKKQRGEEWLPALANEMTARKNSFHKTQRVN
ncbi:hypothetical protein O6H91_03G126000 [Diphasiastrum complanatum]|uniref:Uncharacterized protein n=1 Tax=Diphasiastrum complanatum TaxID=34168 RepID=A0ACC2EBB6_DIPCM|nr:hypothetical protein O6H91_Y525800 [Diphasiastrum complanatum]KAJ7563791.1 hypothetical protein O6H91_03G126000 [Diphasiastrum complanatum]